MGLILNKNKFSNFSERAFIGRLLQVFKEPIFSSTREWMESNIYLSSQQADEPGLIDIDKTPWMFLLLYLLDEPKIKRNTVRKSSRVAYTTIINGWSLKRAVEDKVNSAFCFPKKDSLTTYFEDFLKPAILSTPEAVKIVKKHRHLNKLNPKRVQFDNCTIKCLNLGTASDTKSIFAPNINIEEPDEIKKDVGKQGNAIQLVEDRGKTAKNTKFNIGGTPTDSSFSQIAIFFNATNQMHLSVACHKCGESHFITKKEAWENLQFNRWSDGRNDEIYGPFDPSSVLYLCPNLSCREPWTFEQKNLNVYNACKLQINYIETLKSEGMNNFNSIVESVSGKSLRLGWIAENPEITTSFGLQMGELISSFPGCNFEELGKAFLIAKKRYEEGFEEEMRKFVNTRMGYEYSPLHKGVDVEGLIAKRKTNYKEGQVPEGYPILFCTIDKQRGSKYDHKAKSRFECIVRAHGRNNNSTLVKYEIIEGNTQDRTDPVWDRLTDFINTTWEIQGFPDKRLPIQAVAIDCADESRLVYDWVNEVTANIDSETGEEIIPKFCSPLFGNAVFAVRGSSQRYDANIPIYNDPRTFMEVQNGSQERRTVAETMGITPYIMGTTATHDEYTRRLNLEGPKDRIYHVETAYPGYEKSALSCVKNVDGQWKQITGWPKEIRDCERMQIWLTNVPLVCGDGFLCISQMSNTMWNAIEFKISQSWR